MGSRRDLQLRWICLGFLALAGLMLILGLTFLQAHLRGIRFIVYWAFCFLFTSASMLVALLDIRAIRRQAFEEHRNLLEKTLKDKTDLNTND